MNLDLFADPVAPETVLSETSPVAHTGLAVDASSQAPSTTGSGFSLRAREWAVEMVEQLAASSGALTRLKALRASEPAYEALLAGCLLIASRKRTAYQRAYQGSNEQVALGGWIVADPALASATEQFTRCRLAVNELGMLPEHLDVARS